LGGPGCVMRTPRASCLPPPGVSARTVPERQDRVGERWAMAVRLALAGDTMLGRMVADAIRADGPERIVADEVVELTREADLFLLKRECCVSEHGEPWPDPDKPFFFRAPPAATELLRRLGVDCVTLANNHALDFGVTALLDTFRHLEDAGITWVGAGRDQ